MTLDYPRSIGDGYPEYIDDELGYHYHAWEVISASESARLEAIRLGDEDHLASVHAATESLSDLELWAQARRRLQQKDHRSYFDLVNRIAQGSMEHKAINYPEVFADLGRRYAETKDLEKAHHWADQIRERWSELAPIIPLLKAQQLLLCGQIDAAEAAYRNAFDSLTAEDNYPLVDLLIESAEDFFHAAALPQARAFLNQAHQLASDSGDGASLVDIELLRDSLSDSGD